MMHLQNALLENLLQLNTFFCLQESLLSSLSSKDKADIANLLELIEKTFTPTWVAYPAYQTLSIRMQHLRDILNMNTISTGGTRP